MRPPQVDMDAHDLIIRIPLENIPNMPPTPAGRAMALQKIRTAIMAHMTQGGGGGGGAPAPGGLPPGLGAGPPGAGAPQGALMGALSGAMPTAGQPGVR